MSNQAFVPNVRPKIDPKEEARLQAMFGNMQEQSSQFVIGEKGQRYTLEKKPTDQEEVASRSETGEVAPLNLKEVPTVYFKNCHDGDYVIDHRVTKILIEGCKDTRIHINQNVLTSTVEVWRCENVTLKVNSPVKTLQLDLMQGVVVDFKSKEYMQSVIWNHVEDLHLNFEDDEKSSCKTGFAHMAQLHPDSDIKVDQFIVRFLEDGLSHERCVRLKNGFLSTEREAADWDRRNETARDRFVADFLKQGGIHLNKNTATKKVPRNDPCPCGSGLKYKKCCEGKKEISGLAPGQKKHYK